MRLATALLGLLALPLAASAQTTTTYRAVLSGANEVPANASTATGSATLVLNTTTLAWTLTGSYTGITGSVVMSHIHTGAAGANGGVIFDLANTGGASGTLSGSGTFSTQQALDLKANGLYVNVHSTTFGGGEIRDQLRFATPTIDGVCTDGNYQALGSYTQAHGFGDWGLKSLKSYRDATYLYICVEGTPEGNFNGLYTWLDVSDRATGSPSSAQIPATGGGFDNARPTLELPNTDFGIRFAHDGTTGYVNMALYTGGTAGNEYLGSVPVNGSVTTTASGPFTGASFAYRNKANLTANTDGSGFEIKIELADIAASGVIAGRDDQTVAAVLAPSTFQLFTAYASSNGGDFFSSDVIPEVTGNGAANLGANPNFVTLPGVQATPASTLPVELSSFTASADGNAALLRWTTESETNNAGFSVESLRGGVWTEAAFVAGRGTTSERASYERRIDGLSAGRHTFRLVQRDLDGTTAIGGTVEVAISPEGAFAITERRMGGSVVLGIAARDAQAVTVDAFDVMGRRVAVLFAGTIDGSADIAFDTAALPSGVYLVRVTGERASATRGVVVAR